MGGGPSVYVASNDARQKAPNQPKTCMCQSCSGARFVHLSNYSRHEMSMPFDALQLDMGQEVMSGRETEQRSVQDLRFWFVIMPVLGCLMEQHCRTPKSLRSRVESTRKGPHVSGPYPISSDVSRTKVTFSVTFSLSCRSVPCRSFEHLWSHQQLRTTTCLKDIIHRTDAMMLSLPLREKYPRAHAGFLE